MRTNGAHTANAIVMITQGIQPILIKSFMLKSQTPYTYPSAVPAIGVPDNGATGNAGNKETGINPQIDRHGCCDRGEDRDNSSIAHELCNKHRNKAEDCREDDRVCQVRECVAEQIGDPFTGT